MFYEFFMILSVNGDYFFEQHYPVVSCNGEELFPLQYGLNF